MLKKTGIVLFQLTACAVGFYLIFTFFNYLAYDKDWVEDPSWVPVTGTLQRAGHGGRSQSAVFSYKYNSESYGESDHNSFWVPGNIINEMYILKVNPQKPDHYKVVAWQPMFSKDEKTNIGTCNITSVNTGNYPMVFFEYTIGGSNYRRAQYLVPDYQKLYPNLKAGDQYEIEYWMDNPQRAIIHLNKQTKAPSKP